MSEHSATMYAEISASVAQLVGKHAGNDRSRAAYLTARAAILLIRADGGARAAAEKCFQLADEVMG